MADEVANKEKLHQAKAVDEPKGPAWREPRFPWYGYVLINAVVWIILGFVFFATKLGWFSTVERGIDRPGTAGLLFFIALCFILVSIYDYIFDRSSERFAKSKGEKSSRPQPQGQDDTA